MKDHKFIYFPVELVKDRQALRLSQACLTNALRPVPKKCLGAVRGKGLVACDSGGLQILTLGVEKRKGVLVGPVYPNDTRDPEFLVIGALSDCEQYRRVNASIGFSIDFPNCQSDRIWTYYSNLLQSMIARKEMAELAPLVCPGTKIGIVLHPRHPLEVEHYFSMIWDPKVNLYAYGVGNRNTLKHTLGNAYILSFLHSMGVSHVHFLGSSAPPVILILAKALSLNMFQMVSFDSKTWNTHIYSGIKYLNPNTLKRLPEKAPLDPDVNLHWVLGAYPDCFGAFQARYNPPSWMLAKEWVGIWNIHAIEWFKERALETMVNSSGEFMGIKNPNAIRQAFDLLDYSKALGHDCVRRQYKPILKEAFGFGS